MLIVLFAFSSSAALWVHGIKPARTHARPPPLALTRQRAVDYEGWRWKCDGHPFRLAMARKPRGVAGPRRRPSAMVSAS